MDQTEDMDMTTEDDKITTKEDLTLIAKDKDTIITPRMVLSITTALNPEMLLVTRISFIMSHKL